MFELLNQENNKGIKVKGYNFRKIVCLLDYVC